MERKEFIKKFALGGSILLTAPVLFNSCSDDSADPADSGNKITNAIVIDLSLPAYSALSAVGGSATKGEIIIIRTSYVALSNVCTHQQCTVGYNHASIDISLSMPWFKIQYIRCSYKLSCSNEFKKLYG